MLHVASVFGNRVVGSHVLIELVGDLPTLTKTIDEAVGAGLIVEGDEGYSFTLALIREVLYSELNLPRRQFLHLRAAESIEAVHSQPQSYLASLANHYRLAGRMADPEKTIDYSLHAGDAALSVYAYDQTMLHWKAALEVMEREDVEPARRAAVLERLGSLTVSR